VEELLPSMCKALGLTSGSEKQNKTSRRW
jgi:hypothetical protein